MEHLGPARRMVELSWTEGWDSSNASGTKPDSYDHLNADSLSAVGVRDAPTVLAGALDRLRGAEQPVVYLPRIPPGDGNDEGVVRPVLGRSRHLYGRITSNITTQAILGDEDSSEVVAINAVVIEEEL